MTAQPEPAPTAIRAESPIDFTDERLMEMIQGRLPNGLELLYKRYAGVVKALAMRMLYNYSDAEDLLQEVFLEIWHRAAGYNPLKGRPLSWIATLARRRSIDRLRKRESYGRMEDRFTEEAKGSADNWTHVYEDLALGEGNAYLQQALATLPEAQRSTIKFAYYKQMSQREIAAHTGIPLGTIKTRLELGIKKLTAALCGFEDLLWANNRKIKPLA